MNEGDLVAQKRQVDQLMIMSSTPPPKNYWATALPILKEIFGLVGTGIGVASGIGSAISLVETLAK